MQLKVKLFPKLKLQRTVLCQWFLRRWLLTAQRCHKRRNCHRSSVTIHSALFVTSVRCPCDVTVTQSVGATGPQSSCSETRRDVPEMYQCTIRQTFKLVNRHFAERRSNNNN